MKDERILGLAPLSPKFHVGDVKFGLPAEGLTVLLRSTRPVIHCEVRD